MAKRPKRKESLIVRENQEYDDKTMGDNKDQDSEETLAMQADSRETVAPQAPALRTRGAPDRPDADTREDAGVKLDDPNGGESE